MADQTEILPESGLRKKLKDMGDGSFAEVVAAIAQASENHIGAVGGSAFCVVAQAPTVSISPAYSSGDVIGALMTFDGITRANDVTALLQMISLHTKSVQSFLADLVLFGANPTSSVFTDNAAFSVNAADWDKVIGAVHISDWTSLGTPSYATATNLALPFKPESGSQKLYAVLVSRATPTLGSTSDVKITLKSMPN